MTAPSLSSHRWVATGEPAAWRRVMIFTVFLIAGLANPSPDPLTMLTLGGVNR